MTLALIGTLLLSLIVGWLAGAAAFYAIAVRDLETLVQGLPLILQAAVAGFVITFALLTP